MMRRALSTALLAASLMALPSGARAERGPYPAPPKVGFDQRLDGDLPLGASLTDERGEAVTLGAYFGKRPVVVAFVYYGCPMLCGHVLSGILSSARTLQLDAGKDYDIVIISIDPREKPSLAAAKKAAFVERYKRPGGEEGWHFLTGSEPSIRALTEAAGFRYERDERTGDYAHAAGILVATPTGKISRYFFGTEYSPRDVKFALIEASAGKVGRVADKLMLLCYRYDPVMGTYSAKAIGAVRVGGAATVLSLGAFITLMIRRERRKKSETSDKSDKNDKSEEREAT